MSDALCCKEVGRGDVPNATSFHAPTPSILRKHILRGRNFALELKRKRLSHRASTLIPGAVKSDETSELSQVQAALYRAVIESGLKFEKNSAWDSSNFPSFPKIDRSSGARSSASRIEEAAAKKGPWCYKGNQLVKVTQEALLFTSRSGCYK